MPRVRDAHDCSEDSSMTVADLITLLSELTDQDAEVVIDDSEFDQVSILSVSQADRGEDVVLSNYKVPKGHILHFEHLLYAKEKEQ